jgi:hypothetical protein
MKKLAYEMWTHYPENDLVPEHYSSPFGIIVRTPEEKWEAFTTTACYSEVRRAEGLQIVGSLGAFVSIVYAKRRIDQELAKARPNLNLERIAS